MTAGALLAPRMRLSAQQERSIALSTAPINILDGAVRSGKTIASLLRWLMYVADAPRGGVLAIGGNTYDTIWRNIMSPLMDAAIFGAAARAVKYTRGAPTAIILGRLVEIIPAHDERSARRLQGMTCAGFYLDEATLVPETYFKMLTTRMSVPGSMIFATCNPDGPGHYLKRDYLDKLGTGDLRRFHFTMDDNPGLDPEYVARQKRLYTGLWYRRMILGEWCLAEGAVFDMWDASRHVIARSALPDMQQYTAVGVDYGTSNPFAALLIGVGVDGLLYLVDEWRYDSHREMRQLTDREYSARLRKWLGGWSHPRHPAARGVQPEYVCVDPSAASFIRQLWADGLTVTQADNDVDDGLRTIASLLGSEPGTELLKVSDSCRGWIEEIPAYVWDERAAKLGEDAPRKSGDHSLDAGRYGIYTTESSWRHLLRDDLALAS